MNPLLILPVAFGLGYLFTRATKRSSSSSSSSSSGSGSGSGSSEGFVIEQCKRMVVSDVSGLRSAVNALVANASGGSTVDTLTKSFFGARGCTGGRFPSDQAQITMYAFIAIGVATGLFGAGKLTAAGLESEYKRIVDMLRAAKVTAATWSTVFGGTVPLDPQLASQLQG